MLALELGEETWKLGFSSAFGRTPLVRDFGSRDTKALLAQIAWAKKKLGLSATARVVSCYEAGREGFWLPPFVLPAGPQAPQRTRQHFSDLSPLHFALRARELLRP
jgi:transposase